MNLSKYNSKLITGRNVSILSLAVLMTSTLFYSSAYAVIYGYQGLHPGGSYSSLTNVKGDIFTYRGDIGSANHNQHIDRLIYLFDGNNLSPGFTVGTGYYEGTDGSGTEFYRYYYYVDDGTPNDNQHILYTGIIPTTQTWVTAQTSQASSTKYNFWIGSTLIGSYTCSSACTNTAIAGGASWTSMTSNANVISDMKNLYLERNTDGSFVDWNSVAGAGSYHCNTSSGIAFGLPTAGNINEFTVAISGLACTNPSDGYLFNEGTGG